MVQAEATRQLTYTAAGNEAIHQEMARDPKVFIMGEDIAGAAGRADQGFVDAWGRSLQADQTACSRVR